MTRGHLSLLFWQRCQGNIAESIKNYASGEFMRTLGTIVIAIGLASAPMASAEPLSPGKPAGVHKAQMGNTEWFVFGGLAALGIGIAIATSGGRSSNAPVQTTSVVTTNP